MFHEALEEILTRCPGLECLVLVGSDGLPIQTVQAEEPKVDAEMLAAEIVALAQAARENHREFGAKRLRSVTIDTASHSVLLAEVIENAKVAWDCGVRGFDARRPSRRGVGGVCARVGNSARLR